MKANLPEKGRRWYCGPFAFSAITGHRFEETRRRLNMARGKPANRGITGFPVNSLLFALRESGYKAIEVENNNSLPTREQPTFGEWVDLNGVYPNEVYLVLVTGHYILVDSGYVLDNHTNHRVHAAYAPHRKKRVKRAWRITKDGR